MDQRKEKIFKGIPVSDGTAVASICLFDENKHNLTIPSDKIIYPDKEKKRLKKAITFVAGQLDLITQQVKEQIGKSESEIFVAQKLILLDPSIEKKIHNVIETDLVYAEQAVTTIFNEYENKIAKIDDAYLKERASDIGEIKRRLLNTLQDVIPAFKCIGHSRCSHGQNRIVVARELTPLLLLEFKEKDVKGFVTEHGGVTSHAAIIARALGIPAVTGIKDIFNSITCGAKTLINGKTGEVILWPKTTTLEKIDTAEKPSTKNIITEEPVNGFKVMANISVSDEVSDVKNWNAEGIGLYRTEFEFLSTNTMLNENQQYKKYKQIIDNMDGNPINFRLLDVGGDKNAPFFNIPEEENPHLGCRGSRLLLSRPDLLIPQARALAKASNGSTINVMYPMIVSLQQFIDLKKAFCESIKDIPHGKINHGLMFEVPAACLQAEKILEEADFASIGTNDLIQFLFAVDRNNELVSNDYNPNTPVFWSVIDIVANAARKNDKPLSICGEIAGMPEYISKLIDLGIKTVSVSPRLIPEIRKTAQRYLQSKKKKCALKSN